MESAHAKVCQPARAMSSAKSKRSPPVISSYRRLGHGQSDGLLCHGQVMPIESHRCGLLPFLLSSSFSCRCGFGYSLLRSPLLVLLKGRESERERGKREREKKTPSSVGVSACLRRANRLSRESLLLLVITFLFHLSLAFFVSNFQFPLPDIQRRIQSTPTAALNQIPIQVQA